MSSRAPDERFAEDGELSSLQDLSRRVIFTRHARNDQERHAVSRAKLCRAALGTITVLRLVYPSNFARAGEMLNNDWTDRTRNPGKWPLQTVGALSVNDSSFLFIVMRTDRVYFL